MAGWRASSRASDITPLIWQLAPVVGVWLLMHGRLLVGELYWGDAGIYFYPMWEFIRRSLRQGELPFWNPYVNGGQPLIGNPQMGVFYPTTLLLLFVPTARWLSLVVALHLLWSGIGMRLWLRLLGCSPPASVWGACAWMGCTAVVARAQFPPFLMSIAWYPWVLWGIERVWQQPTIRNMLWLALVSALCILAAHPQSAYLIGVCALLYTLIRWWHNNWRGSPMGLPRPLCLPMGLPHLAGALGLALGWSALYWLPARIVGTFSNYSQMSLQAAERFHWEIPHWASLLYPFVWGNPTWLYVAKGNYWETTAFIGTLPLLLIPFAFERGARLRGGLAAIAVITAWLAMGTQGKLYTLAYYALPGMRLFHDPARWLLITCLMLAALSALGYDRLVTGVEAPSPSTGRAGRGASLARWVLIGGALLCLLLTAVPATRWGVAWQRAFLTPRAREDYPQPTTHQMLQVARHGWLQGALWLGTSLLLLMVAMRLRHARAVPLWIGFIPMQLYAVSCSLPLAPLGSWAQAERVLKAEFFSPSPDNLASGSYPEKKILAEANGGRWWYPQTYQGWRRHISYLTYADTSPTEMVRVAIPNLPMLLPASVWGAYEPVVPQRVSRLERIILSSRPDLQARWLKALGIEWHVRLIEGMAHFERLAPPCPSVQLVSRAVPVQDFDAMLKHFRRQPYEPCEQVLVEGLPHEVRTGGGRVLKVQRRNASLRIRVACSQPAVLVVRETLLPGWRAWVDGQPVPLLYAEGVLRAVRIPPGTHEVQMRYRPPLWEIGLALSLLSGWLALLLLFISLRRGAATAFHPVDDSLQNPLKNSEVSADNREWRQGTG